LPRSSASAPSRVSSTKRTRTAQRRKLSPSHAPPPFGCATLGVEPHEALNIASAADKASAAVHNIASHVDADATRDAWNRSHRAFLLSRCELRRGRPGNAMRALRSMLLNLEALLALARRAGGWPEHLVAGERTVEALRQAVEGVTL
jgi:hypothetical protein